MQCVEERVVGPPDVPERAHECRLLRKIAGRPWPPHSVRENGDPMPGGGRCVRVLFQYFDQRRDVVVRNLVVVREPHEVLAIGSVEQGKKVRVGADIPRVSDEDQVADP